MKPSLITALGLGLVLHYQPSVGRKGKRKPTLQNGWLSTSEPAEGLPLFLRGDDYLHHKYNGVLLMPDKDVPVVSGRPYWRNEAGTVHLYYSRVFDQTSGKWYISPAFTPENDTAAAMVTTELSLPIGSTMWDVGKFMRQVAGQDAKNWQKGALTIDVGDVALKLAEEQVVGADRLVADQADLVVFITGVPNNSKYNNAFLLPDTRTPYANGRPHWRGTGNLGIPIHLYYSKNYKWYLSDYFYPDELTAVANFATAGGLPVGSHLWELSNVIRGTPRDGKPWERGHLTLLTGADAEVALARLTVVEEEEQTGGGTSPFVQLLAMGAQGGALLLATGIAAFALVTMQRRKSS